MIRNLRPRQAADALGIGLSTFWNAAKNDPDFPPIIKLTPRCAVVTEQSLAAYIEKKAKGTPLAAA